MFVNFTSQRYIPQSSFQIESNRYPTPVHLFWTCIYTKKYYTCQILVQVLCYHSYETYLMKLQLAELIHLTEL